MSRWNYYPCHLISPQPKRLNEWLAFGILKLRFVLTWAYAFYTHLAVQTKQGRANGGHNPRRFDDVQSNRIMIETVAILVHDAHRVWSARLHRKAQWLCSGSLAHYHGR